MFKLKSEVIHQSKKGHSFEKIKSESFMAEEMLQSVIKLVHIRLQYDNGCDAISKASK